MIKAGIIGATGYTGLELVKTLSQHPGARIEFVTSETYAGHELSDVFASGPDLPLIAFGSSDVSAIDVAFICLPHSAAAPIVVETLGAGTRVVDLSADFRLLDAAIYARWYGVEHPAPHLLSKSVYGLTEFARDELPGARIVANPGCYPTSVLLALQPVLAASAIAVGATVIVDSKAGVSGAGRSPRQDLHFVEVAENCSPYKIGRAHRHLPEMEQVMAWWSDDPPDLVFSPHLLPTSRGILSTVYVPLVDGWTESRVRDIYAEAYSDEPFVRTLPAGHLASLAHVANTNCCCIGLSFTDQMLIVTSALDNLVKGAAGQAVQNMNVMFGLVETSGLV